MPEKQRKKKTNVAEPENDQEVVELYGGQETNIEADESAAVSSGEESTTKPTGSDSDGDIPRTKSAAFFEKKKKKVASQLQSAKTPLQIYNALMGYEKEKS